MTSIFSNRGKVTSYCVLQNSERPDGPANNTVELRVPSGHYFFMGDNRDNSLDSRYSGVIPESAVIGKPLLVCFSTEFAPERQNRVAIVAARWSRILKTL